MLTTVDPLHAQVIGLSSERMRYLLLILLALAVVTAIQAVGVVLACTTLFGIVFVFRVRKKSS